MTKEHPMAAWYRKVGLADQTEPLRILAYPTPENTFKEAFEMLFKEINYINAQLTTINRRLRFLEDDNITYDELTAKFKEVLSEVSEPCNSGANGK